MKQTAILLPPELKEKAAEKAAKNYESLGSYIRKLIVADLAKGKSVAA